MVTDWLEIEGLVAWAFAPNEPVIALRLLTIYENFWTWWDFEVNVPSAAGYYAAQIQYTIIDWFHVGVEAEGWGDLTDTDSWSHGVGPNVLLRWAIFGFDLTVHARHQEDVWGAEFSTRAHLFIDKASISALIDAAD